MAFTDVYGYGFYPYEYLPPPTNISTAAEKQAATMGMYGLRSFLYPKAFAIAMETARLVGIPLSPFMVMYFYWNLLKSCHVTQSMANYATSWHFRASPGRITSPF